MGIIYVILIVILYASILESRIVIH